MASLCEENAAQFTVLLNGEIIIMTNSNSNEPERHNGLKDTGEDNVIVPKTTLKEAIEASSALLNCLDRPGCSGITDQGKIQVYRIQEKLIKENYKLTNIRQTRSSILFSLNVLFCRMFSVENLMYT